METPICSELSGVAGVAHNFAYQWDPETAHQFQYEANDATLSMHRKAF